jgi:hypothetical protein
MRVIPIDALFDEVLGPTLGRQGFDSTAVLREADVILGVDVVSRHEFLVYGQALIEDMIKSGRVRPGRVLKIELDQATDELEKLVALVELVKGSHDYQVYPGGAGRGPASEPATARTNGISWRLPVLLTTLVSAPAALLVHPGRIDIP